MEMISMKLMNFQYSQHKHTLQKLKNIQTTEAENSRQVFILYRQTYCTVKMSVRFLTEDLHEHRLLTVYRQEQVKILTVRLQQLIPYLSWIMQVHRTERFII